MFSLVMWYTLKRSVSEYQICPVILGKGREGVIFFYPKQFKFSIAFPSKSKSHSGCQYSSIILRLTSSPFLCKYNPNYSLAFTIFSPDSRV